MPSRWSNPLKSGYFKTGMQHSVMECFRTTPGRTPLSAPLQSFHAGATADVG